MASIKNILIDLDGTIIEPEEGIINSILYSLDKLGVDEKNKTILKQFIGPPLIDSYMKHYHFSKELATKAVTFYREYFSVKGLLENTLYEGITEVLEALRSGGFKLFVATSKPTIYSKKIIDNFQLSGYFEDVIGSNLDNTMTDKTEIINYILKTYQLKPKESLMIGDRKYDIIGAKNNGLIVIGAAYGHGTQEEFKTSRADYVINNPLELLNIVSQIKN